MSIVEVKVPELSESVSEASLIEWKKKVGEPVKADEILIEIETDKIVLEIPAPADGVLASIEQPDGAAVLSDQLIATIDTEGMVGAQAEARADLFGEPQLQPLKQPLLKKSLFRRLRQPLRRLPHPLRRRQLLLRQAPL